MRPDTSIKALLIALTDDSAPAVFSINRLKPELLCFFVPESGKSLVERQVQPQIAQMPRLWDWLVTTSPDEFITSFQAIGHALPDLMRTWDVRSGDLVVDMTGATPAMAGAMLLAAVPFCSRVVSLQKPLAQAGGEAVAFDGREAVWVQGNPWDEASIGARREAADAFNRGLFAAAVMFFQELEMRVSGGQKPLYRALADLAAGYGLWERFQYRQAWEKLKGGLKALEMASLWGGPPGLKMVLPAIKQNAGFLERLVLDPQEVKETLIYDLLAHARRRAEVDHHYEAAVKAVVRALEAYAQFRLWKHHHIKSWDVQPEQLPTALQETCRTCYVSDVDGKYKLPLVTQYRALAGLGDESGQGYLAQWAKMKPLVDAADHAVLGHGFEPVKAERFHQLYEMTLKITGISETSLPLFPTMVL
jgi:CRISPR-associated protein (TIGR02710 family)